MASHRQEKSGDVTYLQPVLTDEPWQDFVLGEGFDALTGERKAIAVELDELIPSGPYKIEFEYATVSNDDEFETAVSADFSASYNGNINISTEGSFASSVTYSENAMSIVLRCRVATMTFVPRVDPAKMTDTAREYFKKHGPEGFRNLYGDYYVDNGIFGSECILVYRCHSVDSSSLLEFKSKISGGNSFVTASGAAAFKEAAKSLNITIDMQCTLVNVNGFPDKDTTDPSQVPDLVTWFLATDGQGGFANLAPAPTRARLVHYSQVAPSRIPTLVHVSPLVFVRINALRAAILRLQTLLEVLPDYYGTCIWKPSITYAQGVYDLIKAYGAYCSSFVARPEVMTDLENQASAIMSFFADAYNRWSFYVAATGDHQDEPSAVFTGTYGVTRTDGLAVKVHSAFRQSRGKFRFPDDVEDARKGDVVVGWAIIAPDFRSDGENDGPLQCAIQIPAVGASVTEFDLADNRGLSALAWVFWCHREEFPWLSPV